MSTCPKLQIIKENRLHAKLSKCEFGIKKVEYLGHIISEDGVPCRHGVIF